MSERLRLEITIEPFVAGDPGPHVIAAADVAEAAGLEVEFGPFGTAVTGATDEVIALLADLVEGPIAEGATRLTLQIGPV